MHFLEATGRKHIDYMKDLCSLTIAFEIDALNKHKKFVQFLQGGQNIPALKNKLIRMTQLKGVS